MANEPLKTAVVTDIGKAKLDAAYQAGEKVIISQMALGNSNLAYVVPDPAFTELVNEFGRQDINEGNTTDSWINALVYVDSQQFAGESILEFGLYDTDGDLIVYSSYTPSVVPAVGQDYIQLEIECSVDLYNASAVTIEVTPIYPQATELERGIAKLATEADVAAGIDDEKIVTPKKLAAIAQFVPYNPTRIYSVGEVCYTKDAESGELSYWQWYSNVESLAGKTPLDTANRHIGWQDNTKPFYWIPYTGDQIGMPFFWLAEDAPEWAVMEINVDLPIVVYWRLARRYPDLVNGSVINTGEIRDEFLRVWDNGRGRTQNRELNSTQAPTQIPFVSIHNTGSYRHLVTPPINSWSDTLFPSNSEERLSAPSGTYYQGVVSNTSSGASGLISYATYPRNTARAMAIAI
ncbi:phage tail protein [Vibrio cholerae]|nr:phage tail protein [Vibrio cholerae]ELL0940011.1 phage tail protein [Vibrio cholerae]